MINFILFFVLILLVFSMINYFSLIPIPESARKSLKIVIKLKMISNLYERLHNYSKFLYKKMLTMKSTSVSTKGKKEYCIDAVIVLRNRE